MFDLFNAPLVLVEDPTLSRKWYAVVIVAHPGGFAWLDDGFADPFGSSLPDHDEEGAPSWDEKLQAFVSSNGRIFRQVPPSKDGAPDAVSDETRKRLSGLLLNLYGDE